MAVKLSWNDFIRTKTPTYDEWIKRYKGKTVHDITVNEHTKFSKQYKGWKNMNIEKMT